MRKILKSLLIVILLSFIHPAIAEQYKVRRGDSLWKISKRVYGRGTKWPKIWRANKNKIKRPGHIKPGWTLKIPRSTDKKKPTDAPEGYKYWKTITAKVTAYCPCRKCCGRFANGKTSTGRNAWKTDGCGVYPVAIPYGTMVKIPGIGFRKADDCGPAMKRSWRRGKYHIDVRYKYHGTARKWGRKTLKVKLYKKKDV